MTAVETADQPSLTRSQQQRRDRILAAARVLATQGGYDAVHMRNVAETSGTSLGTLYRYFPSKVHLLVALMGEQTQRLSLSVNRRPVDEGNARDRVLAVLQRATRGMEREPELTQAMLRALMFADLSVASDVAPVSHATTKLILDAMGVDEDSMADDDRAIARVLSQVWMSSLLTWLTGRLSSAQLYENLEVATRLLLGERP